jgi:tetratricopeptide (TPR) repeat protein
MSQLLAVARQVAVSSSGPARDRAVQTALHWGERWRAVDPGNSQIYQTLGELLLAVGDDKGAWRQLSGMIERDPWSGTGYMTVADAFERQGKVDASLAFWQQAIVIDQTNPTPRLRKAQALIALGRTAEGEKLLHDIADHTWHDIWSNVVYQAKDLLARHKPR